MSAIDLSIFRGRLERGWAQGVKSLTRLRDKIVAAGERTRERMLDAEGVLVPVPVRTAVNRRRPDQSRD